MSRKILTEKEKLAEDISCLNDEAWRKVQRYVAKLRQLERMDAKEFHALVDAGLATYGKHNISTYGTLECSFCGTNQEHVKKLIAGSGVYICDKCIGLCNEILAGDDDEKGGHGAP